VIESEMREIGLPPGNTIVVTPSIVESKSIFAQGTPALPDVQPTAGAPRPEPTAGVFMPDQEALGGKDITDQLPPQRPGDPWPPEVLAEYPDPNLSEDLVPLRPEKIQEPQSGPRIAISDLNDFYTYNFGVIPMEEVAEHDFEAWNVGDEDLIISRIYAACGCTATVFGGDRIKADGFLPSPVTLKPGESRPFTIQFDPRAEGKDVTQSKYIQIYSNDRTRFLYDDNEPLSHEIRFRLVMKPE
jgi:hypothetical protein